MRPFGGRPRTTRVMDAREMRGLLELAAEKRARVLLGTARRVGLVPAETDKENFQQEVDRLLSNPSALSVPVLDGPHWRVVVRPASYSAERIGSLSECFELIRRNKLSLRGWDFPHLWREGKGQGNDWVASWGTFEEHQEYWRFHQSGQFLDLFCVRETDAVWSKKLAEQSRFHRSDGPLDWDSVRGYLSLVNTIYIVTEVFEFAARLSQHDAFDDRVVVGLHLQGIEQFVLTTTFERSWRCRLCTEDRLGKVWELPRADLISDTPSHSLKACLWLFERLGWLDPPEVVIQKEIDDFLHRRR